MTQPGQYTIQQAIELARAHHAAGRLADAESICRQIIAAYPNQAESLDLLGAITYQLGRMPESIELLSRAIRANPSDARYHARLGQALAATGDKENALAAYYRSSALDPRIAEVWNNIGTEMSLRGRHDDAILAMQRAAALSPNHSYIIYNLAVALKGKGLIQEAIDAFQKAVRIKPDDHLAWDRLGDALFSVDRLDEAIAAHRKSIALNPNFSESHNNLGNALHANAQFDLAIESYRRAEVIRPDWPLVHYNLALTLLLTGDFENAWPHHEWRGRSAELGRMYRNFPHPQWDGGELNGRRILLHSEQGIGDTIQFIRYIPMVAERGGRIILSCHPALVPLLKQLPHVESIVADDGTIPPFDVQCPLLSLPALFKTNLNSIPAKIPYLHADPDISAKWKQRLSPVGALQKIGLVWAGRPEHANDRKRSLQLKDFATLSEAADVQFISLQKGLGRKQAAHPPETMNLIDWTDDLTDFAQTAGLIDNLDLIITADTSVAHLAGAMGKPVWVLLPFVPDWRWMLDRSDSPWYPTMKLFRQPKFGDWQSTIGQVLAALKHPLK